MDGWVHAYGAKNSTKAGKSPPISLSKLVVSNIKTDDGPLGSSSPPPPALHIHSFHHSHKANQQTKDEFRDNNDQHKGSGLPCSNYK
jgi:hypothetical protein